MKGAGVAGEITEILMARGKLDAHGLERARNLHAASGERLDAILTGLGPVSEDGLDKALAGVTSLEEVMRVAPLG